MAKVSWVRLFYSALKCLEAPEIKMFLKFFQCNSKRILSFATTFGMHVALVEAKLD